MSFITCSIVASFSVALSAIEILPGLSGALSNFLDYLRRVNDPAILPESLDERGSLLVRHRSLPPRKNASGGRS
jgi:hypothetical protein